MVRKSNISKLVFLTSTLLFGSVLASFGQEEQYPQTEEIPETRTEENNPKESGMQIWEMERIQREVRTENVAPANKKAAEVTATDPRERQKVSKEKGNPQSSESVLSFNFLYYLIQKFKQSESVD